MNTPRNGSITSVVLPLLAAAVLLLPSLALAQDVLYVVSDKVGVGTSSPQSRFHLTGPTSEDLILRIDAPVGRHAEIRIFDTTTLAGRFLAASGNTPGGRYFGFLAYQDRDGFPMPIGFATLDAAGGLQGALYIAAGQAAGTSPFVGIGTSAPAHPLQLGAQAGGAYVTTGGVWTNGSSREIKQDIRDLTVAEAEQTLAGLNPVRYAAKADPSEKHVGFIAEDVPELVATSDRKGLSAMDVVAVLTKVVQEQQKTIDQLKTKVEELEKAK